MDDDVETQNKDTESNRYSRVPTWAARDIGLSKIAFRVLIAMTRCVGSNHRGWEGQSKIAKLCDSDRSTVNRAIAELKARGYLKIVGKSHLKTNIYEIQYSAPFGFEQSRRSRSSERTAANLTNPEFLKNSDKTKRSAKEARASRVSDASHTPMRQTRPTGDVSDASHTPMRQTRPTGDVSDASHTPMRQTRPTGDVSDASHTNSPLCPIKNPISAQVVSDHADEIVRSFEASRLKYWPNDSSFPAPTITLSHQAEAWLDLGGPIELILEILDRQLIRLIDKGERRPPSDLRFCGITMEREINRFLKSSNRSNAVADKSGSAGEVVDMASSYEFLEQVRLANFKSTGYWNESWGPEPKLDQPSEPTSLRVVTGGKP